MIRGDKQFEERAVRLRKARARRGSQPIAENHAAGQVQQARYYNARLLFRRRAKGNATLVPGRPQNYMLLISIIIPSWNRIDLLQSVLTSVGEQTYSRREVIVVDNGSSDGSGSLAAAAGANVLRLEENRGFAEAVNLGIRAATGDWLLILNNDVTLQVDYIERLVEMATREGCDFATGKILMADDPGTLEGSFDLVSRGGYAWRCGYGRPDAAVWSEARRIRWAPMTASLFHRRVFDFLGLLDVTYRSYYEDVDFGLRCAKAGFWGRYVPSAVVYHVGSATLGKRSARVYFWSARNQLVLLAKHYDAASAWRAAWPIIIGQLLALLAGAKHGHFLASLAGKVAALGPAARSVLVEKTGGPEAYRVLDESEGEIKALQELLGFDLYWRLYFRLIGR
jgi:GT2 family glycosyltransferase